MLHILLSSSVVSVLDAKLEVATMDRTMTEEKRIMCEDVIWDQINVEGGNWTLTTSCPSFEGLLRFLRGCASFEQIISAMPADYLQPRSIGN